MSGFEVLAWVASVFLILWLIGMILFAFLAIRIRNKSVKEFKEKHGD